MPFCFCVIELFQAKGHHDPLSSPNNQVYIFSTRHLMIQDLKQYSKSNEKDKNSTSAAMQAHYIRPLHCKVTFICWKRMKQSIRVEVFHTVQYVSDKYQVWHVAKDPKLAAKAMIFSWYIWKLSHQARFTCFSIQKNDVGVSCMELLWINWCWNQLLVQLRVFALIQQNHFPST